MDWKAELASRLRGRVAVMGIGNMLRADDSLGPRVASALTVSEPLTPFVCQSVPENWIAPVRRYGPDVILFVEWPIQADRTYKRPREYRIHVAKNRNRPIRESLVMCEFHPRLQMVLPERASGYMEYEFD